jgi:hypothetical protein
VIEVTDGNDVPRILAPGKPCIVRYHEDHGTDPKTHIIRALPCLRSGDRRSLKTQHWYSAQRPTPRPELFAADAVEMKLSKRSPLRAVAVPDLLAIPD